MQKIQGWVEQGNTTLLIGNAAGVISRKVQGSFPGATITAYYKSPASAVAISSISRSSNIVTATIPSGSNFIVGENVTIAGVTDSGFNGTFVILTSGATTITYAQTAANASSSGGSAQSDLRLANIYSDDGITAKANPFVSAADGTWFFYASNGRYDVRFSGAGIAVPFTLGDFSTFDESVLWIDVTASPYLADPSGVNDSYAALAAAWTAALAVTGARAVIYMPPGFYRTTSNLVLSITGSTPKWVTVLAPGATLVPTAAVSIALTLATATTSDGYSSFLQVQGLKLDGSATTGATGILAGENAGDLSAAILLEDVQIMSFDGASSKGLLVRNLVNGRYVRCYIGRCGTNLHIQGDAAGNDLPTTQTFLNCQFREANDGSGGTGRGVVIVNGYRVMFDDNCLFESNDREGFYCVPGAVANNAEWVSIEHSWVEGNQVSGAATDYQIYADGVGAGTVMIELRNVNFNGTPRSIYFRSVVNAILDNIYPRATANSVVIDTNCRGSILNWPSNNVTYATAVTNSSPTTFAALSVPPAVFNSTVAVTGAASFSSTSSHADAIVGAVGANLDLPLQPGNASGGQGLLRDYQSNNIATWGQLGFIMSVRFRAALGTNTVAANDLTLPANGNVFIITGNTQINAITNASWSAGPIWLIFNGTPTVKHNTAGGAGTQRIFLQGSVDLVAAANTVLGLVNDGTQWQEIGRKTA